MLAAGASTRMGTPKALLELPNGLRLAQHQAQLLRSVCAETVIVLGCDAEHIAPHLQGERCVENPNWKTGRPTSVQAGLRALLPFDGCFILPVDTVGVSRDTLIAMRAAAEREKPLAVRPVHAGEEGKVVWVSAEMARRIVAADPRSPEARLDQMIRPIAHRIEVDDPAVLNNINTPEEWERVKPDLKLET